MPKTPITAIVMMGAETTFVRGGATATYSHTRPSLTRLSKTLRRLTPGPVTVLPFSDGWTAIVHPSYHEARQKNLNISSEAGGNG